MGVGLTMTPPDRGGLRVPGWVLLAMPAEAERAQLARHLAGAGLGTHACEDGGQALSLVRQEEIRLLVIDPDLPGLDAFELAADLKRTGDADLPLALAARTLTRAGTRAAQAAGFATVLARPFAWAIVLPRLIHLATRGRTGPTAPTDQRSAAAAPSV